MLSGGRKFWALPTVTFTVCGVKLSYGELEELFFTAIFVAKDYQLSSVLLYLLILVICEYAVIFIEDVKWSFLRTT